MRDSENASCDGLKGGEDNKRKQKEDPSYVVAEIWGIFSSTVIWKTENVIIELHDPARKFSGQNVINASSPPPTSVAIISEKEWW